ncbi:sigma-54-dependent Fis family transcriptional regulator [Geovibrio thiophilus]|uniref:Sigma-54-dependent Fis family transcriptional regulator n=1 Tax=Geovibrio thiophilus TaxID=139438 RepID=A0A410JWR5_9BACT|nr:sigma-54 dependent transcriptional regulator [Geovibrio thiophilus]QAR32593.1 sigma-54-dependent Fis family transcriptional regulator [Geovibrio thiophilus]
MNRILAVDDDPNLLEIIRLRLKSSGFDVFTADSGETALKLLEKEVFDAAVLDMKLEGETGLEIFENIKKNDPELPVIFLTAYGTIDEAVEAMRRGAVGYLTKPFDHRELVIQVEKAVEKNNLSRENLRLRNMLRETLLAGNIIGRSDKMRRLNEQILLAAGSDASVYIQGESGTGKELVAKMLHLSSARKDSPFVAINSSAIPESLMESELFGYEKGAFTGANRRKKGFFEQAQEGTLFMDEVSEMPLSMQAKLLRVLENREVYPLGSEKKIRLDIRLVSASNKDLTEEIKKGTFREDLFYRIHVMQLRIPPLRERREDIPLLAEHFIKMYSARYGRRAEHLSPQAFEKIMTCDWHGNVRELENTIESAVVLTAGTEIGADAVRLSSGANTPQTFKEAKKEFEERYARELMEINKGNVSKASRMADVYRADFYELLKKYSIDPESFR